MNTVAHTSKAAYQHHVSSGNKQYQRMVIMERFHSDSISNLYRKGGSLTRREVSRLTGFELGATAGRVNLLIKDGLLVDKGTVKCSTTGRMVGLVGLPE